MAGSGEVGQRERSWMNLAHEAEQPSFVDGSVPFRASRRVLLASAPGVSHSKKVMGIGWGFTWESEGDREAGGERDEDGWLHGRIGR